MKAEAGAQLVELLVSLMWSANLSAKTICILSYWACRAGAVGGVSELAVAPGKQPGRLLASIWERDFGAPNMEKLKEKQCFRGPHNEKLQENERFGRPKHRKT